MTTQPPSCDEIVYGLAEVVRGVAGLRSVLEYEPSNVEASPTAYIFLDSFQRTQAGQVTAMTYLFICRVCVDWQHNPRAEQVLRALVNPICYQIDAHAQLNGLITNGLASVASGDAGFVRIGETDYRYCDITVSVLSKGAYRSGI